jgi:RimJ/RimL family protein N-acetyltransferase
MHAIQTERLILREFTVEDAPFLLELLNTPKWIQFIGDREVRTVEGAAQYITDRFFKSYETYGFGFYLMILKDGETPIGTSGLIKRDGLDEVDMGFALLPQYEQKGYGFEAGQAVLSLAKDNFNFKRLLAITNQDNYNSQKLLVKLGFKKDKMVVLPNDTIELFLFEKEL